MVEFESRVRIRTEMTDVGQGRHYLFTPEMTALRPNFGHCRHIHSFPKAALRTRVTEVTLHTGGVARSILAGPTIISET